MSSNIKRINELQKQVKFLQDFVVMQNETIKTLISTLQQNKNTDFFNGTTTLSDAVPDKKLSPIKNPHNIHETVATPPPPGITIDAPNPLSMMRRRTFV